jgi:hypothetical protein
MYAFYALLDQNSKVNDCKLSKHIRSKVNGQTAVRFLSVLDRNFNGCIHIRCTLSKLNDCTHILCALSSLYSKYPSHVSKLSNLIGIEILVYGLHAAVGQCAGQSGHLIVLNSKALKIFS